MGWDIIAAMALYSFVLAVSPGPNNTALLGLGARFGFRATVPYLLGMVIGLVVLVSAMSLGVGALLEVYPVAFSVMKYLAFGYVLFLAWKTLGIGRKTQSVQREVTPISWWQAAGFQLVNPKAWIVTATLIAAYLPPNIGFSGFVVAAVTFILATMPGATIWAFAGQVVSFLLAGSRAQQVFAWLMAIALVGSMVPVLLSGI